MKLTKPQRLIDDLEKYAGGSIAVICGSILTRGEQSVDVLKKAVKTLFEINDALRIRISEENGVTEQVITETTKTETEVLSFGSRSELRSYAESYAKVPLDYYGELCEMKVVMLPGACGILAKLHHIIGDAWTLSLLGKQLDEILNGGTPAAFSYTDYCESEEKYLRSKRYGGDRDFFLEHYRRCPEVTFLSESHSASVAAARKTVVVEKKQAKRISDYVHEKDTSFFILFATVTAAYISRVKRNAERFFIGTTVLNRSGFQKKIRRECSSTPYPC